MPGSFVNNGQAFIQMVNTGQMFDEWSKESRITRRRVSASRRSPKPGRRVDPPHSTACLTSLLPVYLVKNWERKGAEL